MSTEPNETQHLLDLYGISDSDLAAVHSAGLLVRPRVDELIESFYDWLKQLPEFDEFFSDPDLLKRVMQSQADYWHTFLAGTVNDNYINERRRVGEAHARIGLPLHIYFAAMNKFLIDLREMLRGSDLPEDDLVHSNVALSKLLNMDTGVVVETYARLVNERITAQSKMLMEMSTPVTQIWRGILMLPVVGIIDSKRAQDVMTATLSKIAETQARMFILDISGVAVVDTAVANHLIKITKATRLMGCDSTISGVSPSIAQTIVELGIDVGGIKTTATLRDALGDAFNHLGIEMSNPG